MRFSMYPEYQETNLERINSIPSHWRLVPCRAIVEECAEKNTDGKSNEYLSLMANIGVIRYEDKGDIGNKKPDDLAKCKVVRAGNLVINSMNYGIGSYGLSTYEGVCSPVYIVLDPIKNVVDTRFALRIFEEKQFQSWAQSFGNGILAHRSAIGWDDLKNIKVALPPLAEQLQLSKFLDHETAKIDALIREQERLIELLQEKRQAVISHAVTKGLDPDVPMKDSGVEWLGEVPAHWEVVAIKWLSRVLRGASPRPIDDPKYFDDNGEYAWVRIADVSTSNGYLDFTKQKLSQLGASLSVKLEPGEMFLSIAGTVGKPCITNIKACIHDGFVYFPDVKIQSYFLYRIFEAGLCYGGLGKMGTQLNLNTDTVGGIKIGLPPVSEIREILFFLQDNLLKIDDLTNQAVKTKSILKERRSALISAAVTGKIDVRGWQPPADESAFAESGTEDMEATV